MNATRNWMLKKGYSKGSRNSYGHPSEYSYLKGEDFFVQFTMRKGDLVTIILYYEEVLEMKHKFVLRLIDEKFYGFGDEKNMVCQYALNKSPMFPSPIITNYLDCNSLKLEI